MINKLKSLRDLFTLHEIDGYIISTRDEYLSEYPPAHAKRLEYLTGFSGSNGIAIILQDTVLFFTDGRYLTQTKTELNNKLVQVFDQKLLCDFLWGDYISEKMNIGFDPKIFTNNSLFLFRNLSLKPIINNLIDQIWDDRPLIRSSKIYDYDVKFAGQSKEDKIAKCRDFINTHKASGLLITSPEAVCWLLNIRASDIEFSPLLLAHAIVTESIVYLFVNANIQNDLIVECVHPNDIAEIVNKINGKILFDDNLCSKYISDIIKQRDYKIVQDPCMLWKACKNDVEIQNMIDGHIEDGIAVCEFLAFLATNDLAQYNEYDLGIKLSEFRSNGKNYISDSFPAIVGFKDNGAVIHYRAIVESAKKISGDGLLLIDSGGQYLGATTDITRVVSVGAPKKEYLEYYTKILKGHLALAMIKFPAESVVGANLDVLARQYLWQNGDDYPHGTGHGVGSFLSVHEGPQSISLSANSTKFARGMVVSNEPGFYKPGEFGIRIENMMVTEVFSNVENVNINHFLCFKMLTLVPYAKNLIKIEMLSPQELQYILNYYQLINEKITPRLSKIAQKWLINEIALVAP